MYNYSIINISFVYFQKENIPIGPPEKKREFFLRDDNPKQTPAPKSNGFEMLSVLSTKKQGEESVQTVSVNGPEEYEETQMTTSELEALIKMKMAGKLKNYAKVMHPIFHFF